MIQFCKISSSQLNAKQCVKSRFWYLLFWLLWASNINLNTISISIRSQNKLSRDITNYNSKKQKMISTPTAYFVDLALAFQFSECKMGFSSWSDRQLSLAPCIICQLQILTQKSMRLPVLTKIENYSSTITKMIKVLCYCIIIKPNLNRSQ